ncbi:hypothetical protein ONS95_003000 [Cadophora gregata]|uniref:uncharacterized protein n=1 Tax=Cadophora gregata TaxID=51156 RepID=UPI0026DD660B|nr:uncharacterized protein ONS95_003000 [Cadophora gregata]KAK0108177.1 hypothetical protein ONS95_003000 [Cadophora gregata]
MHSLSLSGSPWIKSIRFFVPPNRVQPESISTSPPLPQPPPPPPQPQYPIFAFSHSTFSIPFLVQESSHLGNDHQPPTSSAPNISTSTPQRLAGVASDPAPRANNSRKQSRASPSYLLVEFHHI